MHDRRQILLPRLPRRQRRLLVPIVVALLCGLHSGCAALSNPAANGIPVRRLPPELLGESKEGLENIPLSLLRQPQPAAYQLEPGDVLGVWIEGILGEKGQSPPLQNPESGSSLQPSLGYPVPIREDGTITLPFVNPVRVQGMVLTEAQEAVRKAFTVDKQILKAGSERIIVTLQRPRQYHILVIRQDAAGPNTGGGVSPGLATGSATGFIVGVGSTGRVARRSTGFALNLPAYENDVLNALARTGGLPGTDVADEIIIERSAFGDGKDRDKMVKDLEAGHGTAAGVQKIRIPLRIRPGEQLQIRPADIILKTGDIVYVEARPQDVWYSAGLLPAGEHLLPRDTDLDVVEAIAQIGGSINSGGLSTANVNGTLLTAGIGSPSPSLASITRKTPGGQQLLIRVDLNKALADRTERILIQPGDVIMLQQTTEEALATYVTEFLHFNFVYTLVNNKHLTSVISGTQ